LRIRSISKEKRSPVDLRFDIADEMSFSRGTHGNLRIAFGPFIRF